MKYFFYILILAISFYLNEISFASSNENIPATDNSGLTLVVPDTYSGTPGTATFLGPLANSPRTYQLLIHESLLSSIVGQRILGLTWRLPVSATSDWPVADISFSSYDIYLSGSVTPADRSLTFIQNVVGVQKQVRTGSLTIPLNSFTFGSTPNEFGRDISFDSAYIYPGGHLLIEIRHTGFTGTSRSVDAIGTSISGYGTLFSACWTGSYTGTAGSQGNFSVSSLNVDGFVGINEPSEIPTQFQLSQNYPNPFNPVTNLEFEVPALQDGSNRAFVSLVIYDVLGKEVAVLVNTNLNPGKYKFEFDASGLNSGVYYYTMRANNFYNTKKMILIK